ncbi:TPA: hypothetical protein ACRMKO_000245 [Pseudomonas aeruginosa]|uniref:hypothetical protein n=1 Tax=Pseudomonas aeruginosa TaxID=287 RepID=UPI0003BAD41C|nr:hypothetical protein [Pseudomonas aeruginosa]ERX39889.1 hypothetical protein Q010_00632 [Pseudomonas aeruginosa 19660]RYI97767.1 hypothetical protein EWI26_04050 [Pseudomonas aeruginosa]
MSQKTQPDSMPYAEAVDLPEISVEHSTEFLTGSAPCAGVSRPLPAAWLGQRGIYRSRFEAVCNGEQLVDPLTLGELIQRAWPSPSTELAERGTQHRFSTTEQTCRHDFYGVWWNDSGVTKTGRECRHCGFFVADMTEAAAEQAEAERPEVFGLERYRVERTGQGFWPYCVRAGDGTRELFVGHLKQCKRVAAQLATAFEDGKFVAGALRAENTKLSEAIDECDGDRWKLRSERDAANARLHEVATACATAEQQRDAALARVAELESKLAELEKQEPVAWGAFHFGGKRDGKLYTHCETEAQIEAYILDMHRSSDSLTLRKVPLYGAPVAQAGQVPQAWLDVQAERRRQITAEGWTPEHDDLYCAAELPRAAAAYILNGANDEAPAIWPFVAKWWKPRDARSNYVRAGALILAEIERLDRAAATQGGPRDV